MRWIHSGLQGLSRWLVSEPPSGVASTQDLESIRESMLEVLGDAGARQCPRLAMRIRYCHELDTLWMLRGQLMDACSRLYGEMHARGLLTGVTRRFEGLLPQAPVRQTIRDRAGSAAGRRH